MLLELPELLSEVIDDDVPELFEFEELFIVPPIFELLLVFRLMGIPGLS